MINPTLFVNQTVIIHKGCAARDVKKGTRAVIAEIIPRERGSAQVRIAFGANRIISFYVQHTNRLNDLFPAMNDGNPSHRIQLRRA